MRSCLARAAALVRAGLHGRSSVASPSTSCDAGQVAAKLHHLNSSLVRNTFNIANELGQLRKSQSSYRHVLLSVAGTLVGAIIAAVTTWEATHKVESDKRLDEQHKLVAKLSADSRKLQEVLQEARYASVRRFQSAQAKALYDNASSLMDSIQQALERSTARRMLAQKPAEASESCPIASLAWCKAAKSPPTLPFTIETVRHLRAHIAYHTAGIELRQPRSAGRISAASEQLHKAKALRAGTGSSKACENERHRLNIKLGDVYIQNGRVQAAMLQYDSVPLLSDSPTATFWSVRAANNRAVMQFGLAQDKAALDGMLSVAAATQQWLTQYMFESDDSFHNELDAFLQHDSTQPLTKKPSPALLQLANLGAADAVDVLHLPYPPPASGKDVVELQAQHWEQPTFHAATVEYLERVKLMQRKFYTARANAVLFACAPFSDALGPSAGAAPYVSSLPLLDLVSSVLDRLPHGDSVYTTLDKQWIRAEGLSRMWAAVGWDLVELADSRRLAPADTQAALDAADTLISSARTQVDDSSAPHPEVHICIATLAQARYMHVRTGNARSAIEILETPPPVGAGSRSGVSIVTWAQLAQQEARATALQQLAGGKLHVNAGVAPREARWQLCALALACKLRMELGEPISAELADALSFAAEPCAVADDHPLSKLIAQVRTFRWLPVIKFGRLLRQPRLPVTNRQPALACKLKIELAEEVPLALRDALLFTAQPCQTPCQMPGLEQVRNLPPPNDASASVSASASLPPPNLSASASASVPPEDDAALRSKKLGEVLQGIARWKKRWERIGDTSLVK